MYSFDNVPVVIVPDMILGSLLISAKAAIGIPQLATGPQKWVLIKYSRNSLLFKLSINFLPNAAIAVCFCNVQRVKETEIFNSS